MYTKKLSYIKDLSTIENLCLVCLTESKKMHKLDSDVQEKLEEDVSQFYHVLCRVVHRKIRCNDDYPSYICPMCLGLLNISYKFILQFEESHKIVTEYFSDSSVNEQSVSPALDTEYNYYSNQKVPVELISSSGVFDLKDVFVVEDNKEVPNYTGFLKNLGKEVSATFVNTRIKEPKVKPNTVDTASIINLNHLQQELQDNHVDNKDNSILEDCKQTKSDDDMDEEDKNMNSKLSRCKVCHKLFANKEYLNRHVKRMHQGNEKQIYVCEICGVSLNCRSSHYYHMQKHVGKTHRCSYCPKTYPYASSLQLHVMSRHTNERPHLCTVCGKTFSYSNALIYHMRIHTGERNYTCPYCGRLFRMQSALSRHIRVHTGHRPYACKYCDKAFRSKGEVDCHEMIHTGFRPYHCKYCNKGFTKTYNLKVHLMGHPGNHACEICNKTFIELEYLKTHMNTAHEYVVDDVVLDDIDKES